MAWAPAGMGKRGTCPLPFWKCCKVFLCISSYSKTLSRRIIYALFSQPVVGFWGLRPQTPPGLHPWTPLGDFRLQIPNLHTPGKKSCGRPCVMVTLSV